jgi:hypothetical protein
MDFKWLNTAYQFEAEPGGGGGDSSTPTPASTTPAPVAEPVTPPDEPGVAGDVTPPPPPEPAPAEPEPIKTPDSVRGMFQTPPPDAVPRADQYQGPPHDGFPAPPAPPAPPPKVDPPTQEEWELEPGKAAQKMQAHHEWQLHEATAPLHQKIEEQNRQNKTVNDAEYARISAAVQQSAKTCEAAVDGFYAKDSVLNRDEQFRNSSEIQRHVEDTINACVARAMDVADREGDTARLDDITNNPKFLARVLHMAKGEVVISAPTIRPGALPQGPQSPSLPTDDGISQEDRDAIAAAKADGITYTPEQLKAAKAMRDV